MDLVYKRHEGDGWLVFSEVGDKPGMYANRRADALALGVWASTKYEAHLYEFKISREDLKRELRDPKKANAVGKYCTYWWLVVSDESVIADLVIPDVWGILIPTVRGGSRILKVHRKGEKLDPVKIDPTFAMALIRNMAKRWKSEKDYDRVCLERDAALEKRDIPPTPDIAQKDEEIIKLKRELKNLHDGLDEVVKMTGVDLRSQGPHAFNMRNLAREMKVAAELQRRVEDGRIAGDIALLSQTSSRLEAQARELARDAVVLRELAAIGACAPNCRATSAWGRGLCSCGAQPLSEVERKLAGDARRVCTEDGCPGVGDGCTHTAGANQGHAPTTPILNG